MKQSNLIAIATSCCVILALLIAIAASKSAKNSPESSGQYVSQQENIKPSYKGNSQLVQPVVRVAHANPRLPQSKSVQSKEAMSYSPDLLSIHADNKRMVRVDGHVPENANTKRILASLLLPDLNVNPQAIEAIKKSSDPALEAKLLELLDAGLEPVEIAAIQALGELGSQDALTSLGGLLSSANPEARHSSLKAVAKIGTDQAEQLLLSRLEQASGHEKKLVVQSLHSFSSSNCRQALIQVLKSSESNLRVAALDALAKQDNPALGRLLSSSLKDSDRFVRRSAVKALLSNRAQSSLQSLLECCKSDSDRRVRQLAAEALGQMAGPEYIGQLQNELKGQDPDVEKSIQAAINSIQNRKF